VSDVNPANIFCGRTCRALLPKTSVFSTDASTPEKASGDTKVRPTLDRLSVLSRSPANARDCISSTLASPVNDNDENTRDDGLNVGINCRRPRSAQMMLLSSWQRHAASAAGQSSSV